jgi:hypothetical protein
MYSEFERVWKEVFIAQMEVAVWRSHSGIEKFMRNCIMVSLWSRFWTWDLSIMKQECKQFYLRISGILYQCNSIFSGRKSPVWVSAAPFLRFPNHTQWHTSLDEWLAHRGDLNLTTHSTQKRQTSVPPVRFELAIPAGSQPQTHALDHLSTEFGSVTVLL